MLHMTYGHSFRGDVVEGETVESLTLTYGTIRDGDDNVIAERNHDDGLWIRRSDSTVWTDIDITACPAMAAMG